MHSSGRVPTRLSSVLFAALAAATVAGCTSDSEPPDPPAGVLSATALPGDGWEPTDELGRSQCSSLGSSLRNIYMGVDGVTAAYRRDEVTVTSYAWVSHRAAGRPEDLPRLLNHAAFCQEHATRAEPGSGALEVNHFDIVEQDEQRFVVHERHTVRQQPWGADQVYFSDGRISGAVVVLFPGDEAPLEVTDFEAAARAAAAALRSPPVSTPGHD